jgi:DNA repair protein RecO
VAPRAGASRRRFGGALQVLGEVEFSYREKEGQDLGRLEWCRVLAPTPGEGRDLDAFYVSTYIAEVLEQMGREREADERLYRLTQACAGALAQGLMATAVARYFEVWTLRLGGLLPDLTACAACRRDLAQTGAALLPGEEAVCAGCRGRDHTAAPLPGEAVALVRRILARPPVEAVRPLPMPDHLAAVARMAAAQFLHVCERPFRTAAIVAAGHDDVATAPQGRQC